MAAWAWIAAALQAAAAEPATDVLEAVGRGQAALRCAAHGAYRLEVEVRNLGAAPLRVKFPPGLVADTYARFALLGKPGDLLAASAQLGNGGANGGFGLGAGGTQSMALLEQADGVQVAALGVRKLAFRTCCLNFGLPEPTPGQVVLLKRVEDFTPVQPFAATLARLADRQTSTPVAQAALWRLADGLSWEQLAKLRVEGRGFTPAELAAAKEFVQAAGASPSGSGEALPKHDAGSAGAVELLLHPDPCGGKAAAAMVAEIAPLLRAKFPGVAVAHRNWPRVGDAGQAAVSWCAMLRAGSAGRWMLTTGRCVWNPKTQRWRREAATTAALPGRAPADGAAEWLADALAGELDCRKAGLASSP